METTPQLERQLTKYYYQNTAIPHNIDLECAVLGAMMLDRDAYDKAEGVNREMFYRESHKFIFDAIHSLYVNQKPIDILTVMDRLKFQGTSDQAGGPAYLAELTNKIASSANIEYHTKILLQDQLKRDCIRIGAEAIKRGSSPEFDSIQLIEDMEIELFKLTGRLTNSATKSGRQIASDVAKHIVNVSKQEGGVIGLTTGFTELDKMLSGLQSPDLICIAARPGMGKTAFVLSLARQVAVLRGIPVALFSLEMSALQLGIRLVAMEAHVPGGKVNNINEASEAEIQRIHTAIEHIEKAPIYIDDAPGQTIFDVRSKGRKMVRENGCKLIIIDYIQLMSGGDAYGNQREQEISVISRGLKAMAKELDVPVIELSQLSRAVETRGGSKRPQLSDLRESGSIEQDADIVGFIYRPEYYNIKEDQYGTSTNGLAELIIAKHRRGAMGTVLMRFEHEMTLFRDWLNSDIKQFKPNPNDPGVTLENHNPDDDLPF